MANLRVGLIFFLAIFFFTLMALPVQAGFAIHLEKDIPESSIVSVNPIEARIFASATADGSVATESFGVKDLTLATYSTLAGEKAYRLRVDFTQTDALTSGMDLWWELWLGGNMIGKRERVPQSASSLFSMEAADADTVDGQHASSFAAGGHNHDTAYINEGQASSITATMIAPGAAIEYTKLNHPDTDHDYTSQFYTQAQVDAIVTTLTARLQKLEQLHPVWYDEETAESGNDAVAGAPAVAFNSLGEALAVWAQGPAGSESIYAALFTPGPGWGTAVAIDSGAGQAKDPEVQFDTSDNAMALWIQDDGSADSLFANTYSAGSWGAATLVESGAGDVRSFAMDFDPSGNAMAVFSQYDVLAAPDEDDGIFANFYTAGGGWGTETTIEGSTERAREPDVAFDTLGNAIAVFWQDDTTADSIYANHYTAGGGWGGALALEGLSFRARAPRIGIDDSNNAVVVWRQRDGSGIDNVYAKHYISGTWGTEQAIESGGNPTLSIDVGVDSAGNATAVWQQNDGAVTSIYANRCEAMGTWGTEGVIEAGSNAAVNPVLAVSGSGRATVAWEQSDGTAISIYGNTYLPGEGWSAANLLESGGNPAANAAVAIANSGSSMALWTQSDGTATSLYSSFFGYQ